MNSFNDDLSYQSKESGSEPISIERRDHRGNTTLSKIFSASNLVTSRKSILSSGHYHIDPHICKKGKRIKTLRDQLEANINDTLCLPIEYLESTLFDLTHEYYKDRNWSKPVLSTFATMYPIQKLIVFDDTNSEKWATLLDQYINYNPYAFSEMKFFKKFTQFINDLTIIWDISNVYNYRVRFRNDLEFAEFLDLDALFTGFITNEMLWISIACNTYPLSEVLDSGIKRMARVLQHEFNEVFNAFIEANKPNVHKCETIQPWLSHKNPILLNEYCFMKPDKHKPDYQELKYSWRNAVLRKKTYKLRKQLESFEFVYRNFENGFLESVLELVHYDN